MPKAIQLIHGTEQPGAQVFVSSAPVTSMSPDCPKPQPQPALLDHSKHHLSSSWTCSYRANLILPFSWRLGSSTEYYPAFLLPQFVGRRAFLRSAPSPAAAQSQGCNGMWSQAAHWTCVHTGSRLGCLIVKSLDVCCFLWNASPCFLSNRQGTFCWAYFLVLCHHEYLLC